MDADDIRKRVAQITEYVNAGDHEAAHGAEDDLHQDVLNAIMRGARVPAVLAFEALRTKDINIKRWCA